MLKQLIFLPIGTWDFFQSPRSLFTSPTLIVHKVTSIRISFLSGLQTVFLLSSYKTFSLFSCLPVQSFLLKHLVFPGIIHSEKDKFSCRKLQNKLCTHSLKHIWTLIALQIALHNEQKINSMEPLIFHSSS